MTAQLEQMAGALVAAVCVAALVYIVIILVSGVSSHRGWIQKAEKDEQVARPVKKLYWEEDNEV